MSTNKIKEYYRVKADIDLDAIHENVVNAKALTKPGTKLMAIIKADAYGHGAVMVAQTLEDVADAYGVAILEEGIELRQAGINKPILILGYTPAPLYSAMIKYDIATAVFEYDMAKKMSDTAEKMGKKAKVHIKLDTGMSRIGFKQDDESLAVIKKIAELPGIEIEGCFTHFATMDEKDKTKAMNVGQKENLSRLHHELISKDWFQTLPDFNAYVVRKGQALADYAVNPVGWRKKCLVNIAKAGMFSSDRTIAQYNEEIWHLGK